MQPSPVEQLDENTPDTWKELVAPSLWSRILNGKVTCFKTMTTGEYENMVNQYINNYNILDHIVSSNIFFIVILFIGFFIIGKTIELSVNFCVKYNFHDLVTTLIFIMTILISCLMIMPIYKYGIYWRPSIKKHFLTRSLELIKELDINKNAIKMVTNRRYPIIIEATLLNDQKILIKTIFDMNLYFGFVSTEYSTGKLSFNQDSFVFSIYIKSQFPEGLTINYDGRTNDSTEISYTVDDLTERQDPKYYNEYQNKISEFTDNFPLKFSIMKINQDIVQINIVDTVQKFNILSGEPILRTDYQFMNQNYKTVAIRGLNRLLISLPAI